MNYCVRAMTTRFSQLLFAADGDKKLSSQSIKDAKRSYKQVVKLNNAWRDTHKIIKKAEKKRINVSILP